MDMDTEIIAETDSDIEVLENAVRANFLESCNPFRDKPPGDAETGLHMGLAMLFCHRVVEFQCANAFRRVSFLEIDT